MKKLFFLFAVTILMIACEDSNSLLLDKTEYYVKYIIKSPGTYYYFSDITYADVSSTGSAEKGHSVKSWTVTIGPVNKGFRASVKNAKGTGDNQIEVSKAGGPFVLKAEGKNSATYTINF